MPPSRSEPCHKRIHSDSDYSDRSGLRNGSPYIQAPPPSHSSSPQKHQYCLRSVRPERLQPHSRTVKAGHKDSPGHLTYLRRGPQNGGVRLKRVHRCVGERHGLIKPTVFNHDQCRQDLCDTCRIIRFMAVLLEQNRFRIDVH